MPAGLWWAILVLPLGIVAFVLGAYFKRPTISAWLGVATLVLAFSPIYYEFPGDESIVTTFDETGKPIHHSRGQFCWEWSSGYSNMPTIPTKMQSTVTVMTENPKVRRVIYYVSGKIVDPAKFYRDPERRVQELRGGSGYSLTSVAFDFEPVSVIGWVDRAMAPYLYTFNDKHSKELATLGNPLDPEQQERAKSFFARTAEEIEANEGIQVEFVGFALE